MVRRQAIRTQRLDGQDIRGIGLECPNCGFEQSVDVGQSNACGAYKCYNCGIWFQYEEDYEELPS